VPTVSIQRDRAATETRDADDASYFIYLRRKSKISTLVGRSYERNSELIDSSSWVRRIASASRCATERTFTLPLFCASGRTGIVSVTTSSSIAELRRRSIAGPDSTPCVQQPMTLRAPALRSA